MKKIFLKINNKKILLIVFLFVFVFYNIFIDISCIQAADEPDSKIINTVQNGVLTIFAYIAQLGLIVFGWFLTLAIKSIILLINYNDFIGEKSIILAWTQILNFANMFFILAMVIIAFSTILRIEGYTVKKALPKLILMAFLVNYSKSICGFVIDISQFLMVFFADPIGSTGASFIQSLGVDKYIEMIKTKGFSAEAVKFWEVTGGLIVSLIFVAIGAVVLLVILVTLIFRIVMLWIYVVLSPLAFMLYGFPGGQKYFSKWSDEFVKNVVIGPILVFFLWLALIIGQTAKQDIAKKIVGDASTGLQAGQHAMMSETSFIPFLIAIGMLVGGLKVASEMGGAVGGVAGKGLGAIGQGKTILSKMPGQILKRSGQVAGSAALGVGVMATSKDSSRGKLMRNWSSDVHDARAKSLRSNMGAVGQKLGMGDKTRKNIRDAAANFADSKTGKTLKHTGQVAGAAAVATAVNPLAGLALGGAAAFNIYRAKKASNYKKKVNEYDSDVNDSKKLKDEKIESIKGKEKEDIDKINFSRNNDLSRLPSMQAKMTEVGKNMIVAGNRRDNAINNANTEYKSEPEKFEWAKNEILKDFNKEMEDINIDLESHINVMAGKDVEVGKIKNDTDAKRGEIKRSSLFDQEDSRKKHREDLGGMKKPSSMFEGYHVNSMMMNVQKQANKENEIVEKRIESIARGGEGALFSQSATYSSEGQTGTQKKLFEEMSNGSEQSVKAVKNLTKELSALHTRQSNGENLSTKEMKSVLGYKQGIVAAELGGINTAAMDSVKDVLNKLKAHNEDTAEHIDNYKTKVIKN
ncbi:hypothetical protein KAI92_02060 [Candidatus Parcubacteria bacterium]|nr:hypothetical protein [Candidatus Parcubacteria bacterium]